MLPLYTNTGLITALIQLVYGQITSHYYNSWSSYKCPDSCVSEQWPLFKCISSCSVSQDCTGVSFNLDNYTCCRCSGNDVLQRISGNKYFSSVKVSEKIDYDDLVKYVPDAYMSASSLRWGSRASHGRLNTKDTPTHRGAWVPKSKTTGNSYIQVKFCDIKEVTGVGTQGREGFLYIQCITSYKVSYSTDCRSTTFVFVKGSDNNVMVFPGNNDRDTIVWNVLPEPLIALCVRVHPITYIDYPALRFGVKGSSLPVKMCFDDLVKDVPWHYISASSLASRNQANRGRLYTRQTDTLRGAWVPASRNTANEYIQVKFCDIKEISGVATQGREGFITLQCVTTYKVSYSTDCTAFSFVKGSDGSTMVFPGNSDRDTVVRNNLPETVLAACVRVHPITYIDYPAMRFGIKGCNPLPG